MKTRILFILLAASSLFACSEEGSEGGDDMLPAEVLRLLNELLERLHQAGHIMTFIVGENGTLSDISAHDCKIECYRPQQVGYEQENHHHRTACPCVILLK